LTDDELLRFTANLGDMPLAWQALPDASHVKVYLTLKNADVGRLVGYGVFTCTLTADAQEAVDARLAELTAIQLATVIGQKPDARRFGQAAIAALQRSQISDDAARVMETLVIPLATAMIPGQVRAVLNCLQDNPQVRMASRMPSLFSEFFDAAGQTFASCYEDWFTLVQWLADTAPHRDPADRFAYPDLWRRVHSARAAD
jgi:hypothetical protein